MKVIFFSSQQYDKTFFNKENEKYGFEFQFFDSQLDLQMVNAIEGSIAVCIFVNDNVSSSVIEALAKKGVKIIALRCAGFNNVDLEAAKNNNISICRVPAYSPESVAEHTVAMMLTLNRKIHKSYNRVREQNFSLNGLMGFDIFKKTIGVIGAGKIGKSFCKIMLGFGCKVLAYDIVIDKELEKLGVCYESLDTILHDSDIISLHCPLNDKTKYLICSDTISKMKRGVMIINTSRGALIKTKDVISALKTHQIGYLGIDVYEQEDKLFFKDLSSSIIQDDAIQRLMSFPNVLITAHQAFFTQEALTQIASTTLLNIYKLSNNLELSREEGLVI